MKRKNDTDVFQSNPKSSASSYTSSSGSSWACASNSLLNCSFAGVRPALLASGTHNPTNHKTFKLLTSQIVVVNWP